MNWETQDERADRLAQVAVRLTSMVRDEDPAENRRWLLSQITDQEDWIGLAVVLAAAVPVDRSWFDLTAWAAPGEEMPLSDRTLRPCGTKAAYERHRAHGEKPCDECVVANRTWDRERKRAKARERRAAAAGLRVVA